MLLKFRDNSALTVALSNPKALCDRVEGLGTLPIVSIVIPFSIDQLKASHPLRLVQCATDRVVVAVESGDGYKCVVAGVCGAGETPESIADLRMVGKAPAEKLAVMPVKRTLTELIGLLQRVQRNLHRIKYASFRDDKVLALLTAFRHGDLELRGRLRKIIRNSYRGFNEAALQLRCDTFEKKLLEWSSESFVRGVRAATNEALVPIIESYLN